MDYNVTRRILNKGKSMSKFRWLGVLLLLILVGIAVRYMLKPKSTQNDIDTPNTIVQPQKDVSNMTGDTNLTLDNIDVKIPEIGENTTPAEFPGIPEPPVIPELPVIPGQQPVVSGQQSVVSGQQPVVSEQQPIIPELKQVGSEKKLANSQDTEYIIQPGDTLGKICKRHYNNESLATALQKYNDISDPRKMKVNDKIKLPPIEKLGKSSSKTVAENKKTTEKKTSTSKVSQQNKAGKEHKVQAGETLGIISKKYYNTATLAKALQQYNNITDATKIKIGQIVIIPNKEELQPNNNQQTKTNKQVQSKNTSSQDSKYYIVQRGDNLPEIARKLKTTPSAIMNCNPEIAKDPEKIIPGMKILKPAN